MATHLCIQQVSIGDLHPSSSNPRVHTRKQVRQIAESIKAFGFNVPVLVDGQNRVIAGHGRLQAATLLGWTEVPTICLEHLTEAQAKAFMVADNKLTENAAWDDRLLGEAFRDLSLQELEFSLETTGFDMGEIDLLIEGLEEAPPGDDPADDLGPAAGPAVSCRGDLWLLGPHRLLCGSALKSEDLDQLMDGSQASVMFTDPPYNVPVQGHVSGLGRIQHREFAMASGEMDAAQFTEFLTTACGLLAQHSVNGSLHYLCMDWRHVGELLAAGKATYTELKNLCVWAKDNAGMGSFYRSQHELVFVFKNGTAPHQNHVQLGQYGRYRSNVWRYAGVNSFSRATEEGNLLELHPTVKPVALVADALKDASSRGEIVLDTFLGSGTTLMAAERTGRVCCGLELDPLYVDVAVRRWQAFTNQAAVHSESGLTFDQVQAERLPGSGHEVGHV
ncbi:site-specific DNA-methyltransferase [Geothrix terrae]|uniref:site-specific DNA-methyltransferase n=1 Tax=Geothrix terrae TaxID=2922720 RepID=UPI001FAB8D2D|nr:DNA methyltransferase [Geothrix terrae]